MNTLIVYDSVFGNTEQIAQAIGQALGPSEQVETLRVSQVGPARLEGRTLLIVGSPTRGFRPTEAIAKFLDGIAGEGLKGIRVAAFDTRISVRDVNNGVLNVFVRVFGYAAQPIAKKLVKKGGALVVPPEGFFVKGSEGPLKDGERDRAAEWGRTVANRA
jgi:flavodoxin I